MIGFDELSSDFAVDVFELLVGCLQLVPLSLSEVQKSNYKDKPMLTLILRESPMVFGTLVVGVLLVV